MRTTLIICVVVLAAGPLAGSDGATPIWDNTTITQPGSYLVTRELSDINAVIRIDSDDVDVDLNGFTLRNTGAGTVILIEPLHRGIVIRDGMVVSGDVGINVRGATEELTIRNLTIRAGANPITGSPVFRGVFEGNSIVQTGSGSGVAFWLECNGCRIVDNTVTAVDGDGIRLRGNGSHVERNTIRGCSETGLDLGGSRHHVAHNVLTDNGAEGLYLTGSSHVYRGNVARGNAGTGCGNPDFCNGGVGNTSHGDNYMPNQM